MTVVHRVVIRAVNGDVTNDFNPVYNAALAFLNRQPVYTANFDSVDPHYLYQPSATMLLSPIAINKKGSDTRSLGRYSSRRSDRHP